MADENQPQPGGLENLIGAVFLGASIALSSHSTIRMAVVRAGNKMIYFPIVNVAMLANEFSAVLMILSSSGALGNQWNLWAQTASNLAYFVAKPIVLYLAFLRCRAVFEPYRKYPTVHYFLIGLRAIELFVVLIVNVYDNIMCQGLTAGSVCHQVDSVWKIRDGMAPAFRFYYIFSEGTFYVKLFQTLNLHGDDLKSQRLLRLRRYQILIFTLDLSFLISMSVYRILVLINDRLPSYTYIELFSSALTVFVMTEFGLTLTKLFQTSSSEDEISMNVKQNDKITIPQHAHLSQEMKKSQHSTPSLKTNTFGLVKPTNINSINVSASYTCYMNEDEEYDKFDELYSYN
ncbi:14887_t:CDS:1 [Acaulospora morrowiae]|uniref:14887_t:CDS:1 n=1 Tax=Acaulospora morrowiae TaxID=94023 RepID=A0A9N8VKR2_9GLOM|nr:14887_t:CDS:1 [Acaulospora morrowiae]